MHMKFDIGLNGINDFYPKLNNKIYYILKVDNSEKYHSSHILHGGAPAQRRGVSKLKAGRSRGRVSPTARLRVYIFRCCRYRHYNCVVTVSRRNNKRVGGVGLISRRI